MGCPFLLIDGYNLMHAAGMVRLSYAPGDRERLRHRLLGQLCEKLVAEEQSRTTVVFDAQNGPRDVAREQKHQGLTVLFAPHDSDADSVIEELLAHHPAPRQTTVVSSDHRLHKAARRRGATPIDSEPFWEQLLQRHDAWKPLPTPTASSTPASSSRKPVPPKSATQAWLQEFGDISVQELAREVEAEAHTQPGGSPWLRHVDELARTLDDPAALKRLIEDNDTRRQT